MADNFTVNQGADQSLARKHNSSLILDLLRLEGPRSRASLASSISLTRSSVSRIVDELRADRLIREVNLSPGRKGRPGMLLELDPRGGSAIGLEIGVSFLSILLTDFTANILWRERVDLPEDAGLENLPPAGGGTPRKALRLAKDHGMRMMGIGVGVWGLVDVQKGEVRFAPNLKWHDVPLKQLWESRFGLTVFVENDANAAAMGEYYLGSTEIVKNVDDFIYLSTGIGLGGGIISGGRLFRGWIGYAGEVGHMIIDPGGETCMCGKRGCWETLVGSRVAVQNYKRRTGQDVSFQDLVQLLRANDPIISEIFTKMAMELGIGIGNLVNIFYPRCIVVGGVLEQISDFILPIARDTFAKNSLIEFPGRYQDHPIRSGIRQLRTRMCRSRP